MHCETILDQFVAIEAIFNEPLKGLKIPLSLFTNLLEVAWESVLEFFPVISENLIKPISFIVEVFHKDAKGLECFLVYTFLVDLISELLHRSNRGTYY